MKNIFINNYRKKVLRETPLLIRVDNMYDRFCIAHTTYNEGEMALSIKRHRKSYFRSLSKWIQECQFMMHFKGTNHEIAEKLNPSSLGTVKSRIFLQEELWKSSCLSMRTCSRMNAWILMIQEQRISEVPWFRWVYISECYGCMSEHHL